MCRPFFEPAYTTPTLHVVGKTDVVVVEERSRMLIDVSSNKRVEEHEGGEYIQMLVMPRNSFWHGKFSDVRSLCTLKRQLATFFRGLHERSICASSLPGYADNFVWKFNSRIWCRIHAHDEALNHILYYRSLSREIVSAISHSVGQSPLAPGEERKGHPAWLRSYT